MCFLHVGGKPGQSLDYEMFTLCRFSVTNHPSRKNRFVRQVSEDGARKGVVSSAVFAGCCTTRFSVKIAAETIISHLRSVSNNNLRKSHHLLIVLDSYILYYIAYRLYSSSPSSSSVIFIVVMLLHYGSRTYGQLERRQSTLLDGSRSTLWATATTTAYKTIILL